MGRNLDFLALLHFIGGHSVKAHQQVFGYIVLPGNGVQVLEPFHDMEEIVVRVDRLGLRLRFRSVGAPGIAAGCAAVHQGNEQDLVFLQSFAHQLEGRIGLVDVGYRHPVGFGDGKQGLPFQHHVREIGLSVHPHLFL